MNCAWKIPAYRRMVMVLSALALLWQGTSAADLSGYPIELFWRDENKLNVPTMPGGETVISAISLQGAPPNVTVKRFDVYVIIVHPNPQDLSIKLSDQVGNYSEWLWRQGNEGEAYMYIAKEDIHRFDGQPVNQEWHLLIQDHGNTAGGYIDSWQIKVYYEEPNLPPNDELGQSVRLFNRWPYTGGIYGATNQDLINCSLEHTADVWHFFTPQKSREYTFTLNGSLPVKSFTVFDPNMETELACQETNLTGNPLSAQVSMIEGMDYPVRVASLPRTNGNYVICVSPSSLIEPYPRHEEVDVSTDVELSWDGFTVPSNDSPQDKNTHPSSLSSFQIGPVGLYAIHGNDDRQDQYQVQDLDILLAGDSTVAFIDPGDLTETERGTYILSDVETLAEIYNPLCTGEPFGDQPLAAKCSGFLVAPDVIATAGHCLVCKGSFCNEGAAVVFGFAVDSPTQEYYEIPVHDVYFCREIITSRYNSQTDWALVRLDREVVDHKPLKVRRRGVVSVDKSLLLVGHANMIKGVLCVSMIHQYRSFGPMSTASGEVPDQWSSTSQPLKWKVFTLVDLMVDL